MAGFNLPPGVTPGMIPGEQPSICDVCLGDVDAGECVCPECPTCTSQGDSECYRNHGLRLTRDQLRRRQQMRLNRVKADLENAERLLRLIDDPCVPIGTDHPDCWEPELATKLDENPDPCA